MMAQTTNKGCKMFENLLLQDDESAPNGTKGAIMTAIDTNNAEFEAWWLKDQAESWARSHKGDTNTSPGWGSALKPHMWRAWQAARTQPIEPQIDGYPLWSGLPPPVMSNEQIEEISKNYEFGDYEQYYVDFIGFARAILAAQSTDAGNVSKKSWEIDGLSNDEIATMGYVEFGIVADDAELVAFARAVLAAHGRAAQSTDAGSVRRASPELTEQINVAAKAGRFVFESGWNESPITQPMIAEAARDDVGNHEEKPPCDFCKFESKHMTESPCIDCENTSYATWSKYIPIFTGPAWGDVLHYLRENEQHGLSRIVREGMAKIKALEAAGDAP